MPYCRVEIDVVGKMPFVIWPILCKGGQTDIEQENEMPVPSGYIKRIFFPAYSVQIC